MAGNNFFVIDSSFVLSYLLPDERLTEVEEVFIRYEVGLIEFIATRMLPFEVFNGLFNAFRSRRISKRLIKELCDRFLKLNIPLTGVDYLAALDTAMSNNLTFYDACYFHLASKKKKPLLTFDKALQKLS